MDTPTDSRVLIHEVDRSGRIVRVNKDWLAFAQANDAPEIVPETVLGRPLWDFIDGNVARRLTMTLLVRAREARTELRMPFRCDSPGARRFMEMRMRHTGLGDVVYECRLLRAEPREPLSLIDRKAVRSNDFITMCSCCKKVHLGGDRWAEAEEAVKELGFLRGTVQPAINQGVCPGCREYAAGTRLFR